MAIHFPDVPATFIHVPRTAGTSFEKWTEQNIKNFEHFKQPKVVDMSTPMSSLDEIKKVWPCPGTLFTFVRNPFSRLVSMYHRIGQRAENAVLLYSKSLRDKSPLENWRAHPYQSHSMVSAILDETEIVKIYRKGFTHWVDSIYNHSDEFYQLNRPRALVVIKWWTDTRNYVDHYCGQTPDIIVHTENINAEFAQVQALLNCNAPLPHENQSDHDDYKRYYTPETRRMVGELFKRDLDTFNYDF